jgi:hypothetical protein
MHSCRSSDSQDPELLGPAAGQLDFDLVARQLPDQGSAYRRAGRDGIGVARFEVADKPMLTNSTRRKILNLDSGADGSGPRPGRLHHSRRIQQSLKTRKHRREDGLLLKGLQVVIVASDLAESAGFIEALRELDIKLMPQALNARQQRPLPFAGDGR